MSTWDINETEGTAIGPDLTVIEDGALVATLTALWDDEKGVQVSVDWQAENALTQAQVAAYAGAMQQLAATSAPR